MRGSPASHSGCVRSKVRVLSALWSGPGRRWGTALAVVPVRLAFVCATAAAVVCRANGCYAIGPTPPQMVLPPPTFKEAAEAYITAHEASRQVPPIDSRQTWCCWRLSAAPPQSRSGVYCLSNGPTIAGWSKATTSPRSSASRLRDDTPGDVHVVVAHPTYWSVSCYAGDSRRSFG